MTNLFEQHSAGNQKQAKMAVRRVIVGSAAKYILLQKKANKLIMAGERKPKKGKKCLACKLNKLFTEMIRFELVAGEAVKTYEMMFGEKVDLDGIIQECTKKFYPEVTGRGVYKSRAREASAAFGNEVPFDDFKVDDDAPDSVKDLFAIIGDAIKESGLNTANFKIGVIDTHNPEHTMGVNPKDFDTPEDFLKAVKKAQKAKEEMESGKPAEEVLTDAMVSDAEEKATHMPTDKMN